MSFPTPEDSQKRRSELASTIEDQIKKRRELKTKLDNGEISIEEWRASMDKIHAEMNCPIRNNFNQQYGSMGTGLDGRGDPILTSEVRVKCDKFQPITYTTLPEILLGDLDDGIVDIWIYIDGNKVNASACENYAHSFREFVHRVYGDTAQVYLGSGPTPISVILKEPLVLEATHHGFLIKKCPRGLTHNEQYIRYSTSVDEERTVSLPELVSIGDLNKVTIFAVKYPDTTTEEFEAQSNCIAKLVCGIRNINRDAEVAIVPIDIPTRDPNVAVTDKMMGHILTSWLTFDVVGTEVIVSKARGVFPSATGRKVTGL